MESDSPRGNASTLTCYGIALLEVDVGSSSSTALNMMIFILLLRLLCKKIDPLQDVSDVDKLITSVICCSVLLPNNHDTCA